MKYLKENAKLIIAIAIFIVIVVAIFVAYNGLFLKSSSKYGDRLKGIDEIPVSDSNKTEIEENVTALGITSKISVEVKGKIIEIIITVNDDIDVNKSKEVAAKVLEKLTDEQKKCYDVQIFIQKNSEDEKFPIIGYKHHSRDNFTWTKDR